MTIPILAERPPIRETSDALRIGETSITLETVLWAFQQGSTPEDLVDHFSALTLVDVYNVIAYYLRHQDEVDRYLAAQEERYRKAADDLLRQIPETPVHARLRARRLR